MDVNGCLITHEIDADTDDGFAMTVTRFVGIRLLTDLPSPWPENLVKVSRGPFKSIKESVDYAKSWNDANTPPPIPEVKPKEGSVKVETASESISVQIEPPSENPPLTE